MTHAEKIVRALPHVYSGPSGETKKQYSLKATTQSHGRSGHYRTKRGRHCAGPRLESQRIAGITTSASDGTRTRDLRRDRPAL
jgi:hypothetical protein